MRSLSSVLIVAACLVIAMGTTARAQEQDSPAASNPAYVPQNTASTGSGTDAGQEALIRQPLSGVRNLSMGLEPARSYWQPHVDVFGTADSNAQETAQGTNWVTWTSASAGVDVHRVRGTSDFTLSYTSGGMYSNQNNLSNGLVQELSFGDTFSFRRSTLSFFDQSSYLPEAAFGFGGLGGAGVGAYGLNLPGLNFNPGQTVLTGRGKILSNADAIEYEELLTPRSSITFSGGYSLLHYFAAGSNLLDYGIINARAGYNHQLTTRDLIAAFYTFGDYRYGGSAERIFGHTLQVSYGRVISGKLTFQIAAGPQAYVAQLSGSTPGTGMGSGGAGTGLALPAQTQVEWSADSAVQYQERRYGLGVSYTHGVNGGAGVLTGGLADTIAGSVTRQMSKTFSSGLSGGYSRNRGLQGTGAFANQLYDYWFGGLNVTEPLGDTLGLTFSYRVQYQTSNNAACIGPACGGKVLRHLISVGLGWHERPLLF